VEAKGRWGAGYCGMVNSSSERRCDVEYGLPLAN